MDKGFFIKYSRNIGGGVELQAETLEKLGEVLERSIAEKSIPDDTVAPLQRIYKRLLEPEQDVKKPRQR